MNSLRLVFVPEPAFLRRVGQQQIGCDGEQRERPPNEILAAIWIRVFSPHQVLFEKAVSSDSSFKSVANLSCH